MTPKQLKKDLELIHRHLTRAERVMEKIATKLDIDRHAYLEMTLYEIETLLEMFGEKDGA